MYSTCAQCTVQSRALTIQYMEYVLSVPSLMRSDQHMEFQNIRIWRSKGGSGGQCLECAGFDEGPGSART